MNTALKLLPVGWVFLIGILSAATAWEDNRRETFKRVKNAGVYAAWYRGPEGSRSVVEHPAVAGGQIVVQWKEIEIARNEFVYGKIRKQLAEIPAGKTCTFQINAAFHPDYFFGTAPDFTDAFVPFHPTQLHVEGKDELGTPQYWHPNYISAFERLIRKVGGFLGRLPAEDKAKIVAVRLNPCPIGTEVFWVDPMPPASEWLPTTGKVGYTDVGDYNDSLRREYLARVGQAYERSFAEFTLYARAYYFTHHSPDRDRYEHLLAAGRMGILNTVWEPEISRTAMTIPYWRHCRFGNALGYFEIAVRPSVPVSAVQHVYWSFLHGLHAGSTMLTVRGPDILQADQDPEMQAALEFGARYAGYHSAPSVSPGAWIAFRDWIIKGQANKKYRGDFALHMKRAKYTGSVPLPGAPDTPPDPYGPVSCIGPQAQRAGVYARRMKEGGTLLLDLDDSFVASINGKGARVRVHYLDDIPGAFTIAGGGFSRTREVAGTTGRWKTFTFAIDKVSFSAEFEEKADIRLELVSGDAVTLHMIEVCRAHETPARTRSGAPVPRSPTAKERRFDVMGRMLFPARHQGRAHARLMIVEQHGTPSVTHSISD